MKKRSDAGLVLLLVKLGPKLFPILAKLHDALWAVIKPLFGIKSAGIVGSVGLYTYLLTWQMGVALVVFIAIHEYGHVWAMKRCGIKTRGMYFIPGFGAVAVADEQFKTARNEAYIAIMGPWVSFVLFIIPTVAVYYYTRNPLWAAISSLMAFVNLINLLPINPLDGGRILKALAYSHRQAASLAVTVAVSMTTTVCASIVGFTLITYMALIGLFEITKDFGISEKLQKLTQSILRTAIAISILVISHELTKGTGSVLWTSFIGVVGIVLMATAVWDVKKTTTDSRVSILMYPFMVIRDTWSGLKEIMNLRANDIQPIENYTIMTRGAKAWYAAAFLGLIILHITVVVRMAIVPGAELAKELLK